MPTGVIIIIGKSNFSINEEGNEWLWASSEVFKCTHVLIIRSLYYNELF